MGNVRVGVVGAGVMGRTHADAVRTRTAGATLAAVSDPDVERARSAGGACAKAFEDALALIDSPAVEAVIVASPDPFHAGHVAAAIRAGKPVLCEKPLAPSAAECRKLVELEAATGRRLVQVGYMRRFDAAFLDLKDAYARGAAGEARLVRCFHRNARAPAFFRPDMALSNAMVHEFDILRWVLNSEIARIRVDRTNAGARALDDPIVATVQMASGPLATIEVFMNARYGYDIGMEIIGEDGVLVMGAPARTRLLANPGPEQRFPPDFTARFGDAYARQTQAWIDAIAGGRADGATAADGLAATLVAEAGERALASGQWEPVETLSEAASSGRARVRPPHSL